MTLTNDKNRYFLIFITGFCIPISTAAANLCIPLLLIYLLLEGNYRQTCSKIITRPIAQIALLLFALTVIGLSYTSADLAEAAQVLKKYREFFYIPLFLILFRDKPSQTWGLYGFLSAMGLTLFIAYFTAIISYEGTLWRLEESSVFKNYITQNLLMALAAYFLALLPLKNPHWRWLRVLLIVLTLYNIFFVSLGRTGYLIVFCLLLLLSFQLYRLRGLLVTTAILTVCVIALYNNSQIFQTRIINISEDLTLFQQGQAIDTSNSIGTRIEFAQNSLTLVKDKPLLGAGTGSFSYEYNQLATIKGIQFAGHPHNEYLMIAVQWGLLGLGLFLTLIAFVWKSASQLEKPYQYMAQGLAITIAVGCLFNSLWLDTTEGYLFAYFIGLFYGQSRA